MGKILCERLSDIGLSLNEIETPRDSSHRVWSFGLPQITTSVVRDVVVVLNTAYVLIDHVTKRSGTEGSRRDWAVYAYVLDETSGKATGTRSWNCGTSGIYLADYHEQAVRAPHAKIVEIVEYYPNAFMAHVGKAKEVFRGLKSYQKTPLHILVVDDGTYHYDPYLGDANAQKATDGIWRHLSKPEGDSLDIVSSWFRADKAIEAKDSEFDLVLVFSKVRGISCYPRRKYSGYWVNGDREIVKTIPVFLVADDLPCTFEGIEKTPLGGVMPYDVFRKDFFKKLRERKKTESVPHDSLVEKTGAG